MPAQPYADLIKTTVDRRAKQVGDLTDRLLYKAIYNEPPIGMSKKEIREEVDKGVDKLAPAVFKEICEKAQTSIGARKITHEGQTVVIR